jgi:hypothetical protein
MNLKYKSTYDKITEVSHTTLPQSELNVTEVRHVLLLYDMTFRNSKNTNNFLEYFKLYVYIYCILLLLHIND